MRASRQDQRWPFRTVAVSCAARTPPGIIDWHPHLTPMEASQETSQVEHQLPRAAPQDRILLCPRWSRNKGQNPPGKQMKETLTFQTLPVVCGDATGEARWVIYRGRLPEVGGRRIWTPSRVKPAVRTGFTGRADLGIAGLGFRRMERRLGGRGCHGRPDLLQAGTTMNFRNATCCF